MAARAWRVERLDRPGDAYFLVVFGDEQRSFGVATVDAASGVFGSSARLDGRGVHRVLDASAAVATALSPYIAPTQSPRLVWRPCSASRSPLYPIWEVVTDSNTLFVDQQGHLWSRLDADSHRA